MDAPGVNEKVRLHLRAKRAIRHFVETTEAGTPTNPAVTKWLADALREIYSGTDPSKALFLGDPGGRPRKTAEHVQIALEVYTERLVSGSRGDALEAIAERRHLSKKQIEGIYDRYSHLAPALAAFEENLQKQLARFRAPRKPKP